MKKRRIMMGNPMNELWRAQQDAATRMAESWRTLLQPADRTAEPPAPEAADPPPESVGTGTKEIPDGDTQDSDTPDGETPDPAPVDRHATEEVVEPEPEPPALQAIRAMKALGDGQRDFAVQMARWAELQHELADALTTWARRQQDCADALDRALAPFVPGSGERPA